MVTVHNCIFVFRKSQHTHCAWLSDAEHVRKAAPGWHKGEVVLIMCPAGYAYTKMIEAAKAQRGELILVVLGPLTNVALACKLDPQLPSRGALQMH